MGEAQRPLSTRPARLGKSALLVLLLLAATPVSASAAEPTPSPELPSQTGSAAPTPGGPQPEAPPGATTPSPPASKSAPVAPRASQPVEETPHVSAPVAAAPTHVSSARRRQGSNHAKKPRAAKRRTASHGHRARHLHKASSAATSPTLSAMPSQRDDTRYLLAAAALGVLALASLSLQRLLVQLARFSHGGAAT
jgi:hypothetical protein